VTDVTGTGVVMVTNGGWAGFRTIFPWWGHFEKREKLKGSRVGGGNMGKLQKPVWRKQIHQKRKP